MVIHYIVQVQLGNLGVLMKQPTGVKQPFFSSFVETLVLQTLPHLLKQYRYTCRSKNYLLNTL